MTGIPARFGLDPRLLVELREHGLLYDRAGGGELLHAFTEPLATGFHVELLERRGGYDGYGAAGTHVRLAAQGQSGTFRHAGRSGQNVPDYRGSATLSVVSPGREARVT